MKSLDNLRHSFAHVMALAVKRLYPNVKFGIGPVTESGFFYDFEFDGASPSEDILVKIEEEMKNIIKEDFSFEHQEVSASDAKEEMKNQPYKLELINDLTKYGTTNFAEIEEIGAGSKKAEADTKITLYTIGEFTDLCRGGHVDKTGKLPKDGFKLTGIAGAYWRGNEDNKMLTRIYGAAFSTNQELNQHIEMLEEAKRRDHRIIGKKLDLFTFSDLVGAGLPMFTPRGVIIRNEIEKYLEEIQLNRGYQKVWIPHLAKKELYETSGHWEKFGDDIFHVYSKGEFSFVLKPMNCPHHTQIYASRPRSYKELPVRYFEVTEMYRDEKPGQLQGLTRVRAITIDDAHCFCMPSQVKEEAEKIYSIIEEFYKTFGMKITPRLSKRDMAHQEKYIGEPKKWDEAEEILRSLLKERVGEFEEVPGEAAFYGPKIDFEAEDVIGRKWQLATIQVDFAMPERFGLEFVDENGNKERAAMLHRAISGSLERFMAILIENFAGAFPVWLAPLQVAVLPIGEKFQKYGGKIASTLQAEGIRVEMYDAGDTLSKRIREAEVQKVPYIVVVGEKEQKDGSINVRKIKDSSQETLKLENFVQQIKNEIKGRRL